MSAMELAAAEFAAGMTALAERIYATSDGGRRSPVAAISADDVWGYERVGRNWVAFLRDPAHPRHWRNPTANFYGRDLGSVRRATFEHDHPLHGPARPSRSIVSLA